MKRSCEKISQLASDELERKLSLAERFSMWFHFLMCGACKQYHQNLHKLHQVLMLKRTQSNEKAMLPSAKRALIEQALQTLPTTKK